MLLVNVEDWQPLSCLHLSANHFLCYFPSFISAILSFFLLNRPANSQGPCQVRNQRTFPRASAACQLGVTEYLATIGKG